MNETTATIIRSVLKVAGGFLVSKGYTTDGSLEIAIGAVVALVGFVWGIIAAKKATANKL